MQFKSRYLRRIVSVATWILAALPATAQQDLTVRIAGKPLIALDPNQKLASPPLLFSRHLRGFPLNTFIPILPARLSGPEAIKPVFSPADLAFFCRLEYKMEKALKFPVRIRLGEVQYVEEMEGKINSMRINPARREDGLR